MNKESNDLYYEVMMSDFVTLGKGHYERGNNASVEEINYQRDGITAFGTMSLNDDLLQITLQYRVAGLKPALHYYIETQGFELITETLTLAVGELELEANNGLIQKVCINAEGQTWQWQKDNSDVLLMSVKG